MKPIITFLVLFSFAVPALTGCGGDSSASTPETTYAQRLQHVEVDVAAVSHRVVMSQTEFTGNLLPRRVTRIVPEVEGVVRNIPQIGAKFNVVIDGKEYSEQLAITYGQMVKKDDLLIQLDSGDAELALKLAEAKLKKAKAELSKLKAWERPEQIQRLKAQRDEALARNAHAESVHRRVELLVKKNAVTNNDLERAAMEVSTTKATLDAAEATFVQAKAGPIQEEIDVQQALIDQAEVEVEQHKQTLEKGSIRAPYDGVVTSFQVEEGDRVTPGGDAVVEIMDLNYLVAEIAIPETYIGRVKVNDRATVSTAGSSKPVPGMVIAVNGLVDPQTRTFHARVAIDNNRRLFKAGQFATVQLSMGTRDSESLAVPREAVVFVEGQPHVFTIKKNQVTATRVEIGTSNAKYTEVLSGLNLSDAVVIDDPSLLSDGMRVSVRKQSVSEVVAR